MGVSCCLRLLQQHRLNFVRTFTNFQCIPIHTCAILNPISIKSKLWYQQLPPDPDWDRKISNSVRTGNNSAAVYLLFLKKRNSNLAIDLEAVNDVISCYCVCYQVDYGFSMLGILFKLGFLPNHFTYHSLLTGLVAVNKHLDADILFHKLIRLKEIQPDIATYDSFAKGVEYLADNQSGVAAIDLNSFSRSVGLLTYVKLFIGYDALIVGCCKLQHKLTFTPLELYQEMISIPLTPSDNTYNSILQSLFHKGDYINALSFLTKMKDKGVPLHSITYAVIIDRLCKDKHFHDALAFLSRMEVDRCSFLTKMKDKGVPLHSITYEVIIDRLCKDKRFHDALAFSSQMEVDRCSVGVHLYNSVINHLFSAGEVDKAIYVFNELSDLYHIQPDATTYTEMLLGFTNEGLWDEALNLLPEIESNDNLPHEFKLACHNYFNDSPPPHPLPHEFKLACHDYFNDSAPPHPLPQTIQWDSPSAHTSAIAI